jgi:hypothetical protein
MAALRQLATYHSDDGQPYTVLIPVWTYALPAPAVGFTAYDVANDDLPRGMSMRYVTAKDPVSLRHRKIHCGAISAAAWTTLGSNVTLPNIDATTSVYVTDGRVGEKLRAR